MHPTPAVSDPVFWEERYTRREDGWDLGGPTPVLARLLDEAPPPRGRVAVPGCGRGHDVRLLARHGYAAVGFDFAEAALEGARRLAAAEAERAAAAGAVRAGAVAPAFERRDVFALADAHAAEFDLVWEYTCFCAIDPARRVEYVDVLAGILRPGGRLLALFFPVDVAWPGGPPFPATRDEIRRVLARAFRVDEATVPEDSVPPRRGAEWLVRATRLGADPAKGAR